MPVRTSEFATYRHTENLCEEQQEYSADDVDDTDGDVVSISPLIHVRTDDADSDEQRQLENHDSNGLSLATALSEGHKHTLCQ